jgi:hypothetical protein
MESKKVPGFFVAGEVCDVDGVTGGFNFQVRSGVGDVPVACGLLGGYDWRDFEMDVPMAVMGGTQLRGDRFDLE